jgi:hypothetical protein
MPDVTDIVVWEYDHLRIIGIARRGDTVDAGPAARALASHTPRQSRPTRRRALRRHPSYPAFIAPDGSPYDAGNVVTANGWCVDTARLQATARHFAPRAVAAVRRGRELGNVRRRRAREGDRRAPRDIEAALTAHEEAMFPRSESEAADARLILELCLGDRAPFGLIDLFTSAPEDEYQSHGQS